MHSYQLVAKQLLAGIDQGRTPPGTLLPSEHELAARHSVSRTTVRQALGILELEGRVRRERGRGTIVSAKLVRHLDPLQSFSFDMQSQGIAWRRHVVESRLTAPPSTVRSVLRLARASRVLFVRDVRYIHGRPYCLNERYIHPAYRSYYRQEVASGTIMYAILAAKEGRRTYAETAIQVLPAPAPEAKLLTLKQGALVLVARFVNYLDKTEAFEVVDAYYPVNRWTFAFRRLAVVETGADMLQNDSPTASAGRRGRSGTVTHSGVRLRTAPPASA